MQQKQLKKIFDLINKTGDRFVVADEESGQIYIVLNIEDYESLIDNGGDGNCDDFDGADEDFFDPYEFEKNIEEMTEQEMLQKINDDIAVWREAQKKKEDEDLAEEIIKDGQSVEITSEKIEKEDGSDDTTKKTPAFSSLGEVLNDEKYLNREFDGTPRVQNIDEEDLSSVEHTEEKFYLEPVE